MHYTIILQWIHLAQVWCLAQELIWLLVVKKSGKPNAADILLNFHWIVKQQLVANQMLVTDGKQTQYF